MKIGGLNRTDDTQFVIREMAQILIHPGTRVTALLFIIVLHRILLFVIGLQSMIAHPGMIVSDFIVYIIGLYLTIVHSGS